MYIILATQTLWQLWMETSEDKYFWKAIVLLELVLRKSPHNYHARFLLLRFYNQIGKHFCFKCGLILKYVLSYFN